MISKGKSDLPILANSKPSLTRVRRVGIEPTTNCLKGNCSTPELTPQTYQIRNTNIEIRNKVESIIMLK